MLRLLWHHVLLLSMLIRHLWHVLLWMLLISTEVLIVVELVELPVLLVVAALEARVVELLEVILLLHLGRLELSRLLLRLHLRRIRIKWRCLHLLKISTLHLLIEVVLWLWNELLGSLIRCRHCHLIVLIRRWIEGRRGVSSRLEV